MSIGIKGFIELLIKKIKEEGIYSSYHSDTEREDDVIRMIWEVYEEFKN